MADTAHYDVAVIGTGPAGQKAAIQAAKLGRRVVAIERQPTVSGGAVSTGGSRLTDGTGLPFHISTRWAM